MATDLGNVKGPQGATGPQGPSVQSDWTQTDSTQLDYIKHKPTGYEVDTSYRIIKTDSSGTFIDLAKQASAEFGNVVSNLGDDEIAIPLHLIITGLTNVALEGKFYDKNTTDSIAGMYVGGSSTSRFDVVRAYLPLVTTGNGIIAKVEITSGGNTISNIGTDTITSSTTCYLDYIKLKKI